MRQQEFAMGEPDNIVLDFLRAMRSDLAKSATRLDNLTAEVPASNAHVAAIVQSDLHQNVRMLSWKRGLTG
jgi:hypothetical protein